MSHRSRRSFLSEESDDPNDRNQAFGHEGDSRYKTQNIDDDVIIRVTCSRSVYSQQEDKPQDHGTIRKQSLQNELTKFAEKIIDPEVEDGHIVKYLDKLQNIFLKKRHRKFFYPVVDYQYKCKGIVAKCNLLHLAVLHNRTFVAKKLIDVAPSLAHEPRKGKCYQGETPFHMAIAKKNIDIVKYMVEKDKDDGIQDVIHKQAIGEGLLSTVMMGEIPLSIAALTNNDEMLRYLVRHADPNVPNSKGDTLIHSIIKWGFHNQGNNIDQEVINRLKTTKDVLDTVRFRRLMSHRNNDGLTALQLCTRTGQSEVFQHLIENFFTYSDPNWNLKEIQKVDVSELDRVCWKEVERSFENDERAVDEGLPTGQHRVEFSHPCQCVNYTKGFKSQSALEGIFYGTVDKAVQFMSKDVTDELVYQKWKPYRKVYYILGILHLSLMCLLTALCIYRMYEYNNIPICLLSFPKMRRRFVEGATGISFIFGFLYSIQEIIRLLIFKQSLFLGKFHHNFIYRIAFFLFGLSLMIDSVWNWIVEEDNNYCLYFALTFGWFSCLFFLRGNTYTSFYTYMVLTSIFGEVLFFLPIMIVLIMSFPVAMTEASHCTFPENWIYNWTNGSVAGITCLAFNNNLTVTGQITGFDDYWESLFTMFQWMNGLGEIENIDEGHENTAFSVVIFIMYISLSNTVLIKIVIALLTSRDDLKNTDRFLFLKLQKLSVIIFLEDFLGPLCKACGKKMKSFPGNVRLMQAIRVREDDMNTNPTILKFLILDMLKRNTHSDTDVTECVNN